MSKTARFLAAGCFVFAVISLLNLSPRSISMAATEQATAAATASAGAAGPAEGVSARLPAPAAGPRLDRHARSRNNLRVRTGRRTLLGARHEQCERPQQPRLLRERRPLIVDRPPQTNGRLGHRAQQRTNTERRGRAASQTHTHQNAKPPAGVTSGQLVRQAIGLVPCDAIRYKSALFTSLVPVRS